MHRQPTHTHTPCSTHCYEELVLVSQLDLNKAGEEKKNIHMYSSSAWNTDKAWITVHVGKEPYNTQQLF